MDQQWMKLFNKSYLFITANILAIGWLFLCLGLLNSKASNSIEKIKEEFKIIKQRRNEEGRVTINLHDRTIYIDGYINGTISSLVVNALNQLKKNKGDINLKISSSGSSDDDVFQIIDAINAVSQKVNTIALGECFEGSSYLLMAGTGLRQANRSCFLGIRLNRKEKKGDYYILACDRIRNVMKKTKNVESKDDTIFITAEEAIKYNIIDGILGENTADRRTGAQLQSGVVQSGGRPPNK